MRYLASVSIAALLFGLVAAGCSGSGLVEIHGTVLLDGKPIEDGTIQFLPADGQGPSAAARLEQGKYTVPVMPGKKKVKVEGFKTVGEKRHNDQPDAPLIPIKESIVPEKFNRNTELTREIVAGTEEYDFDLTTN